MPLVSLELRNFRIYEHILLKPDRHLNLISGLNASGKTSLLEAINLLGTGRSFRTSQTEQLRRAGSSELSVVGKLQEEGGETARLSLVCGKEGRRMSLNGLEQRHVSSLALQFPLQVISPDTHYDFLQNAKFRRAVLDWGLFHVEPHFLDIWTRFRRILHQRNAILKMRYQQNAQYAWDEELTEAVEKLQAARSNQVEKLLPHFQSCCQQILGENQQVDLILESGWNENERFGERLRLDRARDIARGFTHSGPQRADLLIFINGQESKQNASHGQHKALVIALRLAQIQYLLETINKSCCLLIDDLAAELDFEHRARLTNFLSNLPVQAFITTTESTLIDRESWSSYKTFHVEQGVISG